MSNDDDFLSYQMSTRLSRTSFGIIWNRMSSLGWTYDSNCSEYFTPFGINVGSAIETLRTLDLFALPPLSFRPNSYDGGYKILRQRYDGEAIKKLQMARYDLLKAIFIHGQEQERSTEARKMRKSEAGSAATVTRDENIDSINADRSLCGNNFYSEENEVTASQIELKYTLDTRMNTGKTMSATQNEPGTEQFFAKQVRRSRRNKSEVISPTKGDKAVKDNTDKKNEKNDVRIDEKQKLIFGSSQLAWPNPQDCVKALRGRETRKNGENQSQTSLQILKTHASEWTFLLSTNHSLILYGFGSKRDLLNDFAERELSTHGDVLTLDGYDSDISISKILDVLVHTLLGGTEPLYTEATTNSKDSPSSDLICRAVAISKHIARSHPQPVYLVLHNIDGLGLRSQAAQNCLAALIANSAMSSTKRSGIDYNQTGNNARVIRLITSVDRVDAVEILWDVTCSAKFSWIWKQASTYFPYHDEVMFAITDETRKIKEEKKNDLDLRFMQKTLSSLAPRHTEVLKVLAQLQLAKSRKTKKSSKWTCFNDCVQYKEVKEKCVKEMVLSSDTDLKNIMNELRDHGMVVRQLDYDKEDIVSIPTTRSKIMEILNLIGNNY